MTPLRVSRRSAKATSTPPATIHENSGITRTCSLACMSRKSGMPSAADSSKAPQVTSCAPRSPMTRPEKPAMIAASSGRKTTAKTKAQPPSALHHVDVFDPDRAAVAEVDDEDGKAYCRFRRGNRQNEHREGLADQIVEKHREGDKVYADREQHQLDRHQHDDHVLA